MDLPEPIANVLAPLFESLPLQTAMGQLVVRERAGDAPLKMVEQFLKTEIFTGTPTLAAGLWLYVDELDRSHEISQSIHDATGSFWHGIMHRREGDFSNSHYWFNRVGQHPAAVSLLPEYDAHLFIDQVAQQHTKSPELLIERQRMEWWALFTWCAQQTTNH